MDGRWKDWAKGRAQALSIFVRISTSPFHKISSSPSKRTQMATHNLSSSLPKLGILNLPCQLRFIMWKSTMSIELETRSSSRTKKGRTTTVVKRSSSSIIEGRLSLFLYINLAKAKTQGRQRFTRSICQFQSDIYNIIEIERIDMKWRVAFAGLPCSLQVHQHR